MRDKTSPKMRTIITVYEMAELAILLVIAHVLFSLRTPYALTT